jgi:hypothetical protein
MMKSTDLHPWCCVCAWLLGLSLFPSSRRIDNQQDLDCWDTEDEGEDAAHHEDERDRFEATLKHVRYAQEQD